MSETTVAFLKALCPVGKLEFNDLSNAVDYSTAMKLEKNIYFLAWVKDNKKRNSDKDIIHKNYFFVDFDLRKTFQEEGGGIITDGQMVEILEQLKLELRRIWYWDYRYIVSTGNWYHFYYVGNGSNFGVEEYRTAVEYYYNDMEKKLKNWFFAIDKACKNIGRIARLPWTKNYWRKKFGLEPKYCEIIEETDTISEKIEKIPEIYEKTKSQESEEHIKAEIKRQMLSINDDTLEHILNLDIIPLIEEYTGLEIGKDGKNFPDKEGNTWMFTVDNVLIHTWTARISDKFKGYNTFTFVREHYCNWNNNDTFERFKDRYPEIRELSNKLKKEYKQEVKQQQIKASLEEDIRIEEDEVVVDFSWNRPSLWLDYIDEKFRRLDPGWELTVLFWPPWSWKTEYWFFFAKANRKYKTIVFCLEIPKSTILSRRALRKFWIRWTEVDKWVVPDYMQWVVNDEIKKFEEESKDYLRMISIKSQPTIEQLIDKMYKESDWKTIFIIDNLWKIKWDDNENIRYADITSKLQTFAYNNRSWVMLQHHTVKPADSNRQKSSDQVFSVWIFWPYGFRGSQKIYDNATRMIEIHRDYDTETAMLFQYKHTPTDAKGTVELVFKNGEYKKYDPTENNPF